MIIFEKYQKMFLDSILFISYIKFLLSIIFFFSFFKQNFNVFSMHQLRKDSFIHCFLFFLDEISIFVNIFNINNRTYYFYENMVNIKDFDSNLLKIDKKSFKNIAIYYIGYITKKRSIQN